MPQRKKLNLYGYQYPSQNIKAKRTESYGFQCLTPVLTKKDSQSLQQINEKKLRLSDKINKLFIDADQSRNQNLDIRGQNTNWPRDITWQQLVHNKTSVKAKLSVEKQQVDRKNQKQINIAQGFLIIKTIKQNSIDQYPQNLEELQSYLQKVKRQNKVLKEENFKLRLQKVKQSSNSQALKTISLKSDIQKIKDKIMSLKSQKQYLEDQNLKNGGSKNELYFQTNQAIDRGKQVSHHAFIDLRNNKKQQDNNKKQSYQILSAENNETSQNKTTLNYTYQGKLKNNQVYSSKQKDSKVYKYSPKKQSGKKQQYFPKFVNKEVGFYGSGQVKRNQFY